MGKESGAFGHTASGEKVVTAQLAFADKLRGVFGIVLDNLLWLMS
jgi:hypothetical protein